MPKHTSESQILQNVRAVVELERRLIHQRTTVEGLSIRSLPRQDPLGLLWFTLSSSLGWSLVNLVTPTRFDPYPFSLLLVSLEAIILTSFVLVTQNGMTQAADRLAHIDLPVNLLAEQELTAILHMLHPLCRHAGVGVRVRDCACRRPPEGNRHPEMGGCLG